MMKAEESGGGQSVLFQPNLLPLRRMCSVSAQYGLVGVLACFLPR